MTEDVIYNECDLCGATAVLTIHPVTGELLCAPCMQEVNDDLKMDDLRTETFIDMIEED